MPNLSNSKITGNYSFNIWKENDVYIAECFVENEHVGITDGYTENEVFEMIADLFLTVQEVKVSWWDKFWHRLLRLN